MSLVCFREDSLHAQSTKKNHNIHLAIAADDFINERTLRTMVLIVRTYLRSETRHQHGNKSSHWQCKIKWNTRNKTNGKQKLFYDSSSVWCSVFWHRLARRSVRLRYRHLKSKIPLKICISTTDKNCFKKILKLQLVCMRKNTCLPNQCSIKQYENGHQTTKVKIYIFYHQINSI